MLLLVEAVEVNAYCVACLLLDLLEMKQIDEWERPNRIYNWHTTKMEAGSCLWNQPRVQLREAKETKRGCDEAGLLLRSCGLIPESCAVYA